MLACRTRLARDLQWRRPLRKTAEASCPECDANRCSGSLSRAVCRGGEDALPGHRRSVSLHLSGPPAVVAVCSTSSTRRRRRPLLDQSHGPDASHAAAPTVPTTTVITMSASFERRHAHRRCEAISGVAQPLRRRQHRWLQSVVAHHRRLAPSHYHTARVSRNDGPSSSRTRENGVTLGEQAGARHRAVVPCRCRVSEAPMADNRETSPSTSSGANERDVSERCSIAVWT